MCSLLCGIVLLIGRLMMETVKRGSIQQLPGRWSLFSLHKKTRGWEGSIYFMGPGRAGCSAVDMTWDTLSGNSKRVLLVATQGHRLVALWLWGASVNFSFVVRVVWRKVDKSQSQVTNTNRSLALARSQCVFHILDFTFFFMWVNTDVEKLHRKTLTGEGIDNLKECLPCCLNLGA